MKEVDILKEIALKAKINDLKKNYQNYSILNIPLNYSLFSSSSCIASCETILVSQKKKGVVYQVFDRRGSQFHDFLWQKFIEIHLIFTKL